ncbi:MAG: hypothetical protein JXA35_03045 [Deltaproteobacteria bacterium]|nr:hypothetical protein [Deltaproteobacteria bacterium]
MKKFINIIAATMALFLVLMFSPILAESVSARNWEIVTVHGHSGHVEYMDRVQNADIYKGWGLNIDQKPGLFNWIHFSIPVPYGAKVRYLGIQFKTLSGDIMIADFHVYNGGIFIYDSPPMNLTSTDNTYRGNFYVIDMGVEHAINSALSLCINIGAGVEAMNHAIQIFAAGTLYFNE